MLDEAGGLFRRSTNVGEFADLRVPMQMRSYDALQKKVALA